MVRKPRLLLDREADKQSASSVLKAGMSSEFWGLIVQALDESMDHLQSISDSDELADLSPERYKLESELLKHKKQYLKRMKEYPTILINRMQSVDFENYDFDPYEKPSD